MRKARHGTTERTLPRLAACALAALGACSPPDGAHGVAREHYNVLLISLDSTRRDLLSSYGYRSKAAPEQASSPHLDALAAGGVLMEEAYATTSWTLPSHVSIFTGAPELVHGVDFDTHEPDPRCSMLAEVLQREGYRTAGFFSGPYLDAHFGFARGFDVYESRYGTGMEAASKQLEAAKRKLARAEERGDATQIRQAKARSSRALEELQAQSRLDVSSQAVTDSVLAELRRAAARDQPFFLFAHYFDPHYDYLPPDPYDRLFDPRYEGAIDGTNFYYGSHISRPDPEQPGKRLQVVADRDLEHIRALYAGELAWTDAQVGRILDRLDALGLAERTLVIVIADHGDEFFEHGSLGHRLNLYEESVQIPMILRLPDVLPAGRRVNGLVATTDIYPTVLDVLGIERPAGLVSRSFLSLARGTEDGSERHVIGRIVALNKTRLEVPDPERQLDALLVQVIETFRFGAIKITRERSWKRPLQQVPDKWRAAIERAQREDVARERLVWIDIEQHPDERMEDHSSDFGNARARAALDRFRATYGQLLARRGDGELREADEDMLAQLRGLGYAGAGTTTGPIGRDEFLLPPPGESLSR